MKIIRSKSSFISPKKRRQARIRAKISGTALRPRISVFRSNRFISAQLIDDIKGKTLASFSSASVKSGKPLEKAKKVGLELAKLASTVKVKEAVFDRSGYVYTGKVKALAEGAREGGLIF